MTTEERLASLEGELTTVKQTLRRVTIGGGFLVGIFALYVAVSVMNGVEQRRTETETIAASEFRVFDSNGKVSAVLTHGSLILIDENGKRRAMLKDDGLSFYDETGTVRAAFGDTLFKAP